MNTLSTSIEPRNTVAPLANPLRAYANAYSRLPHEPEFDLRSDTPMLRLSGLTLATLRHAPFERPVLPSTRGILSEAAMRIVCIDPLGERSAWSVAEELHNDLFPTSRPRGLRRGLEPYRFLPRKGWDAIRGTDALDLIEWWCDVEDPYDWRRFETVRLSEALRRLPRRGAPGLP